MGEKKGQLHQLLAVVPELEAVAKHLQIEATNTFTKKPDRFVGAHKILKMFDAERQNEEMAGGAHQEVTETVPGKLAYLAEQMIPWLDAKCQFERTNQEARADVVLDGEIIISQAPGTFLLGLENILRKFREVLITIPTLSPGIKWVPDPDTKKYVYRAEHTDMRDKNEKDIEYRVVVAPTKEHPAQVREVPIAKTVGRFETTQWSGMISPAQKSDLLGRCDTLLRAVKSARQEANTAEVVHQDVGKTIMDTILGDLV